MIFRHLCRGVFCDHASCRTTTLFKILHLHVPPAVFSLIHPVVFFFKHSLHLFVHVLTGVDAAQELDKQKRLRGNPGNDEAEASTLVGATPAPTPAAVSASATTLPRATLSSRAGPAAAAAAPTTASTPTTRTAPAKAAAAAAAARQESPESLADSSSSSLVMLTGPLAAAPPSLVATISGEASGRADTPSSGTSAGVWKEFWKKASVGKRPASPAVRDVGVCGVVWWVCVVCVVGVCGGCESGFHGCMRPCSSLS